MKNKIVFMGTPIFSVPILKSLYQNGYPVSVVYTQPPNKSQRGQKLKNSPIHNISEILNLEVRTPLNLKNNENEYNYLKNLNADLAIVVAYGQIIPEEFLNLTKYGFINIHASLLPKWRGAAPIQRSIMNLDKETGISFMKIVKKLDEGPVCKKLNIKISEKDNYETLSDKLSSLASENMLDIIDDIFEEKVLFEEQNHEEATYANKILKSEGEIKWTENAENILGKINGLYPSPGAWFVYKGERYKILNAELSFKSDQAGKVVDNNLEIACGNNKSIKVIKIQRQGKNIQNIGEFMLGSSIKKDTNLNNV
ncbi:MAG: methionyl-tRNA formyltransferase [Pelagibacteraceae bacterium]|nr:methionyl-tRNA formyltransferase [Pelagibacteraceae bacterium]